MQSTPDHRIVAFGELLWDLLPDGPRLGGAPANFATLTARLGGWSSVVTCLGDDALGREAHQRLKMLADSTGDPHHLEIAHLHFTRFLPTGTVAVTLDADGKPQYTITGPVAWDAIPAADDLLTLAGEACALACGTLSQRNDVSRNTLRAMVKAAPPSVKLVCDANLRLPHCTADVLEWSVRNAHVLKVSDEELPEVARLLEKPEMATGFPFQKDMSDAELTQAATAAAEALLAYAPQCELVALTLGSRGSLIADRSGADRHSGFPVTVVDTIGAGDAFTAGLVHAYLAGAPLTRISAVANRCGSYVAGKSGATPEFDAGVLNEIHAALAG